MLQPPAYYGNQHNIINPVNHARVKCESFEAEEDTKICKTRNKFEDWNCMETSDSDQSDADSSANKSTSINCTTPFSVKDILNLVDQNNSTNFNKGYGFNFEEVQAKNMDLIVDDSNQKGFQNEFAFPHQQYDLHSSQYDVYNNYHSSFPSFYNGSNDNSGYFGNGNYFHHYEGNSYANSSLQEYNQQFSVPGTNFGQYPAGNCCYNNSGYNPNYYQSEPISENVVELPQKSTISSKQSCDSLFVHESPEKSSPTTCTMAPSYPEELEVSSIINNEPGMTSQHVRQLNSLCVPFDEKKCGAVKSKDLENGDSMQSEY